jgi:hypothetical protein
MGEFSAAFLIAKYLFYSFMPEIFSYRQGSLFEKILAHRCAPVAPMGVGVGTRNCQLRLVDTSSSCDEELAEPREKGKKPLFVSEVFFSHRFCSTKIFVKYLS